MYDAYTIEAIIIVVRVQTGPHGELFKAIYDDSDRRRVGKRNGESEKKKKRKKKTTKFGWRETRCVDSYIRYQHSLSATPVRAFV